jgi:predicted nucleic acid-binding protein
MSIPRIYLDNCSIQRPLDDQSFTRIHLESEAILAIVEMLDAGEVELIISDASIFENTQNPNVTRKSFGEAILRRNAAVIHINPTLILRSQRFIAQNLHPLDALHLACAESANVDYFCTCDDKLYKKALLLTNIKTVTPIQLIERLLL